MDQNLKEGTLEKEIHLSVGKLFLRKDGRYTPVRDRRKLERRYALGTWFDGPEVRSGSKSRSISYGNLTMERLIGYLNGIFDVLYLGENITFEFSAKGGHNMGWSFCTYKKRRQNDGQIYYNPESWHPAPLNYEEIRCIYGQVPSLRKLISEDERKFFEKVKQ